METIKAACPLCTNDAEYYDVDFGNRKYFKCPKCTKFQLGSCAEKWLSETSITNKKELSDKASSAPDEHLLTILKSSPPSPSGIIADYVAKSTLRL